MATRRTKTSSYRAEEENEWDGIERRKNYYVPILPEERVSGSTLTLKELGGIFVVVATMVFGGVGIWTNLNSEIVTLKLTVENFKEQDSKDMQEIKTQLKETNTRISGVSEFHMKDQSELERRLRDLDATVTQLYGKISTQR